MNSREKGRNGDKDRLPFSREGRGPGFTGKAARLPSSRKVIIFHLVLAPAQTWSPAVTRTPAFPRWLLFFISSRGTLSYFLKLPAALCLPGACSPCKEGRSVCLIMRVIKCGFQVRSSGTPRH